MDDLKRIEKILREHTSEKKEKKPGLKFNLGLALIGLRTTGPSSLFSFQKEGMLTLHTCQSRTKS